VGTIDYVGIRSGIFVLEYDRGTRRLMYRKLASGNSSFLAQSPDGKRVYVVDESFNGSLRSYSAKEPFELKLISILPYRKDAPIHVLKLTQKSLLPVQNVRLLPPDQAGGADIKLSPDDLFFIQTPVLYLIKYIYAMYAKRGEFPQSKC
jgi:hypothetical protein